MGYIYSLYIMPPMTTATVTSSFILTYSEATVGGASIGIVIKIFIYIL